MRHILWLALGASALLACDNDQTADVVTDTGTGQDAIAVTDTGTGTDAGTDASTTGNDGSTTDAAGTGDAGFPVIHNCTAYTDGTAAGDARTITFGINDASLPRYDPSCLHILVGQTVTFMGEFASHPLRPGLAPSHATDPMGSSGGPIMDTDTGTSASFTFSSAGIYPYYCNVHQSAQMVGAILVTTP